MSSYITQADPRQAITNKWLQIVKPPRPLEEIYAEYTRGRIRADDLVSSPWCYRLTGHYSKTFWWNHKDLLERYVLNIDADDLFQVCQISVLGAFDKFDPDKWASHIVNFLTLQMFNDCRAEVRRNRVCGRMSNISLVHMEDMGRREFRLLSEASDKDDDLDDIMVMAELFSLMNQLGTTHQRVLTLYYIEDFTDAEIGAILKPGKPLDRSTVFRYRHEALDVLREKIGIPVVHRPARRSNNGNGNGKAHKAWTALFPDVKVRKAKFILSG